MFGLTVVATLWGGGVSSVFDSGRGAIKVYLIFLAAEVMAVAAIVSFI